MHALLNAAGVVIDLAESPFDVADPFTWQDVGASGAAHWWTYANGTFTAPPPPPPAEIARAALASRITAGISITSAGSPTLDATYSLDAAAIGLTGRVARDAASGLGLPGGGETFVWPDMSGTPREFSAAQVIELYKAMRDLLLVLDTQAAVMAGGGDPVWPAQTATIA